MKKSIIITGFLILTLFGGVFNLHAQTSAIIKGYISDAVTKEALMHVNIVEIDKNGRFVSGAITDLNGNYVMKVSDITNPIQISYIGYEKQTIEIKGRTKIDILLQSQSTALSEFKVSVSKISNDGFTKVRDRATSVARLETKDMQSVMSTSVEDMLQGRVGNVDISSISGDPGAGLNIRIRGTASLNARNNPLIVINGIPYDAQIDDNFDFSSADIEKFGNLIDVSPEDIETIEVLKDAASTAAWGSKASNGVLMIKTKRGIKSKPIFEYTFKSTTGREPDPIPMLDDRGYVSLITQEHYNVNRGVFESDEIAYNPEFEEYHNFSRYSSWIDSITQLSQTTQHDFSVRGGGDKSRYNMSLGYFDEGGTTINNNLKKLTLRSSLDYDLSSKLQFNTDIMFTRYDQNNTYDVEDGQFSGNKQLRSMAYRRMPNLATWERDQFGVPTGEYFTPRTTIQGNAGDYYNPIAFARLGVNEQKKDNARALFSLRFRPSSTVLINSTVTLDIFDNKRHRFLPYKAIGYNYNDGLTNRASDEFSKKNSIYTINKIVYTPNLGDDHELAILSQVDTEESNTRWHKTETSKSASPLLQSPTGDINLNWFSSNYTKLRTVGIFTNASYKFRDKYMITLGARYEGTSRFSEDSRWGLFPTVSGAWRINREGFMSDIGWINDLKIRMSWGQSGNSPNGNYLYHNVYESRSDYSYLDMQGVRPKGLELTSLVWETIDQANPGISFFGIDNRLNIEIDYYRKKTLDLYLENSGIPWTTGFSGYNRNEGEMENRGFEFMFDYTIIRKKDLEFSVNMNVSQNKNIILSLPDNYSLVHGDMLTNGNYKISLKPGQAMGGFFGYRYLGVYKDDADAVVRDANGDIVYGLNSNVPLKMIMGNSEGYVFEGGDAKYDDINKDGKIDENDLVYLGDLNPKFMGGAGARLKYKNVVLNTFLVFKVGQKIINQTRIDTENMYGHDNQSKATNSRWRSEGDETDIPRALYNEGFNWLGSDRFVEDGSYLRLKTLSLSYFVPQRICKKLRVKNLKLYTTAYNLYTWTNYSGQDPDVAPPSNPTVLPKDYSRTPPSQKIMFGINVKL